MLITVILCLAAGAAMGIYETSAGWKQALWGALILAGCAVAWIATVQP